MRRRQLYAVAMTAAALLAWAAGALAQLGGSFRGGRGDFEAVMPNPPYDGRFTFVRLRYGPPTSYVGQQIPWSHDYPTGEQKFMRILNEVSFLGGHVEETSILALDDPEIFKYPVAYMAEPGFWRITPAEAESFAAYLRKGGFVIFDDFTYRRGGWEPFEYAFRQVLPEAQFVDLEPTHPIFHAFFEIDSFDIVPQMYDTEVRPSFRGVFEDNDPQKRLLAMINFNTDISEYWEFAGTGLTPVGESNEAYKLGVNYVIYGMTH